MSLNSNLLIIMSEPTRSKQPASDPGYLDSASANPKQREDDFQQSTQYYSYLNHQSKQSLLKDYVTWLLTNTLLALFISALQPILLILVIICIRPIYQLFRLSYTIFIIMAIILPSLYYLHLIFKLTSLSKMSYHIDALYTIVPFYLSIIFKDSIIVASHFRYNIRMAKKEKYAKLAKLYCPPYKKLIIKYLDYSIWGTTLRHYTPYGKCVISRPHTEERNCKPFFNELFPIQQDKGGKIHFKEYYSESDHILRYIMRTLAFMLSVLPTVFFFVYHAEHKEFHYSGVIAVIGMVFLMMVSLSVNEFIEIIFYQLNKYYCYMNALTCLLELVPDLCNCFHIVCDNESSEVSMSQQLKERRHKTAEVLHPKEPLIKETILLFDGKGNNGVTWFENWSRVERLACMYFAKRQSIVFALFTTVFACIVCILYYYINDDIYNTITVSIFGGFLYSSMVLVRLSMFALKISSVESRQIEFIRLQQTYLKHRILISKQKEKSDQCEDYDLDNAIVAYLDDVVRHIEIAGVKLDTALVRMTMSSFAGFTTALITYLLSHVK